MKKKIIASILILTMGSLIGCSSKQTKTEESNNTTTEKKLNLSLLQLLI